MGICFTNTKPFDVVSIQDESLDELPNHVVKNYEMSRDIDDLPMEQLNAGPSKPVIFTVKPLTVLFENVVYPFTDMHAARALFREHVIDVKGVTLEQRRKDKDGKLTQEACEMYPMKIVLEVAQVIIEAQQRVPGGPVPFTPTQSDTYFSKKTALKQKTHLVSLIKSAQEADVEANELD